MEYTESWGDYEALAEWEKMGLHLPTINDVVCDLEPPGYEDDLFEVLEGPDSQVILAGIAIGLGLLGIGAAIAVLLDEGMEG